MKVVLCGSRRFADDIRQAEVQLKEAGHIVLAPILNTNRGIDKLDPDLKRYAFLGLTLHHFEYIRKADVCFVYNKGGYMGNSSTMELGFAAACGVPIYALEEDMDEPCRNVLFDFVTGTVDQFISEIN